jgi:dTDP-4-dehydrorhamnose 3,5-epimerase
LIFKETKLKGAFIIEAQKITDDRGFFGRSWCKKEFEANGLNSNVVQANLSYSKTKGTLRGLHYQVAPYSETKAIRCFTGSIYDVIIDIRPDSPTFRQWIGVELSGENGLMLYIPEGFAHGFMTLQDNSLINYLNTAYYTPGAEGGIMYNDPAFNVEWPMEPSIISDKDKSHAPFQVPN